MNNWNFKCCSRQGRWNWILKSLCFPEGCFLASIFLTRCFDINQLWDIRCKVTLISAQARGANKQELHLQDPTTHLSCPFSPEAVWVLSAWQPAVLAATTVDTWCEDDWYATWVLTDSNLEVNGVCWWRPHYWFLSSRGQVLCFSSMLQHGIAHFLDTLTGWSSMTLGCADRMSSISLSETFRERSSLLLQYGPWQSC